MANILGVNPADISHRLDPNSERKLNLAEGLREAWALCGANADAGRRLQAYLNSMFVGWLGEPSLSGRKLCAVAGDVAREFGEFMDARLRDLPAAQQMKEAVEARETLDRFIHGLQSQQNSSNLAEFKR